MLRTASVWLLCLLSLRLLGASVVPIPGKEPTITVEEFSFEYEEEVLSVEVEIKCDCDSVRMITVVEYGSRGDTSNIVGVHKLLPGELEKLSFPLPQYQMGATVDGMRTTFRLQQEAQFVFKVLRGDKSRTHKIYRDLW
jgi:hypothetical protein